MGEQHIEEHRRKTAQEEGSHLLATTGGGLLVGCWLARQRPAALCRWHSLLCVAITSKHVRQKRRLAHIPTEHTRARIQTQTHTHTHTRAHARTHAHTHTHTTTNRQSQKSATTRFMARSSTKGQSKKSPLKVTKMWGFTSRTWSKNLRSNALSFCSLNTLNGPG